MSLQTQFWQIITKLQEQNAPNKNPKDSLYPHAWQQPDKENTFFMHPLNIDHKQDQIFLLFPSPTDKVQLFMHHL